MDLKNRKAVRTAAVHAVQENPGNPKGVAGVYVAVTIGMSLVSALLMALLDNRIAQTGGLANMGLRSILSTIQSILPVVQALVLILLQLGYQKAALEITRHRAVTPRTLLQGAPRFGAMIRAIFFQYILYMLLMVLAMYGAAFIFTSTPFSNDFYELVMADTDALNTVLSVDSELFPQLVTTLLPAIPMFLGLALLICAPVFYGYRMVGYCILSGRGALMAMKESSRMMKGHKLDLFKLDCSFWWFYLAQGLTTVILYGDVLLNFLGVPLPWSATVSYYVFYVLSLLAEGLVYYCFLNRVETAYATAYNILRPKSQPTQGVVLGNIFDLAKDHNEP